MSAEVVIHRLLGESPEEERLVGMLMTGLVLLDGLDVLGGPRREFADAVCEMVMRPQSGLQACLLQRLCVSAGAQAAVGRVEAFGEFIQRHAPGLRGVHGLLGGEDAGDGGSQGVVQRTASSWAVTAAVAEADQRADLHRVMVASYVAELSSAGTGREGLFEMAEEMLVAFLEQGTFIDRGAVGEVVFGFLDAACDPGKDVQSLARALGQGLSGLYQDPLLRTRVDPRGIATVDAITAWSSVVLGVGGHPRKVYQQITGIRDEELLTFDLWGPVDEGALVSIIARAGTGMAVSVIVAPGFEELVGDKWMCLDVCRADVALVVPRMRFCDGDGRWLSPVTPAVGCHAMVIRDWVPAGTAVPKKCLASTSTPVGDEETVVLEEPMLVLEHYWAHSRVVGILLPLLRWLKVVIVVPRLAWFDSGGWEKLQRPKRIDGVISAARTLVADEGSVAAEEEPVVWADPR
jgi:hypothetical protein